MTEIRYNGTKRSAADLTSALTLAGIQVLASTPNSPKAATDFWVQAHEMFDVGVLQAGLPRDYRALIRGHDHEGRALLVRVQQGASLIIEDDGQVFATRPASTPASPGVSVWQTKSTGQAFQAFTWDGTDLGFSDLIAFFQLRGSLLNKLAPAPGSDGFGALQGTATVVESGQVYTFEMTRQCVFLASGDGTVQTVSPEQLPLSYDQVS
ncbi:MAG TPA: hypothetical protein PKE40_00435 [Arachnia sp.]|nr:hypothetical protein [Arachnia sp.]HMT84792.1 hypothetical protein [Arachnia sp.]